MLSNMSFNRLLSKKIKINRIEGNDYSKVKSFQICTEVEASYQNSKIKLYFPNLTFRNESSVLRQVLKIMILV